MDKIERLINLTAVLLDKQSPLTFDDLKSTVYRDETGGAVALKKMFERDKEELRDMGIEVRTVPLSDDRTGYTIEGDAYYLPHLELEPSEKLALAMVSRLFLGSGTPFAGPAQAALCKIAFDEGDQGDGLAEIHWVSPPREREALAAIMEGLAKRKFITFSYRALDRSEPSEREVEPYGLFSKNGYWYLVGQCHLRGELRCFKLDRIVSDVKVSRTSPRSPDFEVPEDFEIETSASWEWPPPKDLEDVEARVVFAPRLAFAFSSGRSKVVSSKRHKDGSLEATYEVADPEQFVDWVLEFGPDARVVSPPELTGMVAERLQGALARAEAGK